MTLVPDEILIGTELILLILFLLQCLLDDRLDLNVLASFSFPLALVVIDEALVHVLH